MLNILVLIPSYKPDEKLITLAQALLERELRLLVVDDGGGETYARYFDQLKQMGVPVVHHAVNLGKGRALKTGLNEILLHYGDVDGVITADADGQHTPDDICNIRDAMGRYPGRLIIGSRAFTGVVPAKSMIGNTVTRFIFRLVTGMRIHDTQTGLRGLPREALGKLVPIEGERYEYEMNMLLKLSEMSLPAVEVPIETVYENNNRGSHFRLMDAWIICKTIVRFAMSSVLCCLFEYGLFYLLNHFLPIPAWLCHPISRLCSCTLNYKLNQVTVFKSRGGKRTALKYLILVGVILVLGTWMMYGLTKMLHVPDMLSKIITDSLLFVVSYVSQREIVFRRKSNDGTAV